MYNNKIDQQLAQNDCGISAIKTCYNVFIISISRDYTKRFSKKDFEEMETIFDKLKA